jgi:hypothetical protein
MWQRWKVWRNWLETRFEKKDHMRDKARKVSNVAQKESMMF